MHLDTMRVDSADGGIKAACCYAAYGYMGDLMRHSEAYRKLGSLRYTLSGAFMLLRGRSYAAQITYLPTEGDRCDPGHHCLPELPRPWLFPGLTLSRSCQVGGLAISKHKQSAHDFAYC